MQLQKKGCSKARTCRKTGIKCSLKCGFCNEKTCENKANVCKCESGIEKDENLSAEFKVLNYKAEFNEEDEDHNINRSGP